MMRALFGSSYTTLLEPVAAASERGRERRAQPNAAKVAKLALLLRGAASPNGYLGLLRGSLVSRATLPRQAKPPPRPRLYNARPGHGLVDIRARFTRQSHHRESSIVEERVCCNGGLLEERRLGRRGDSRLGGGGLRRSRGVQQVRRRRAAELGQRPRRLRGRPPQAPSRQLLRRGIRVQEQVPVRQGHRRPEARARGLCRGRHCFLSVVGGGEAQRVRLRVPGQRDRRAVPGADQPVHRRRGQPGAAHRPLVRPHRRLPHLLRALEPQPGRLPRRRHPHPRLREQDRHQGPPPPPSKLHRHPFFHGRHRVPVAAAHGGVQLHLERGRLGHAWRPGQDRLVPRALRGHLPGRQRRGVRVGGQRHGLGRRRGGALHGHLVGQGGKVLVEGEGHAGALRAPEPPARLGARAPPRLRLLRRHRPLPRPAARVRRPLNRRVARRLTN